jgi:hypothetical protein
MSGRDEADLVKGGTHVKTLGALWTRIRTALKV